jgi:hypothetical protein
MVGAVCCGLAVAAAAVPVGFSSSHDVIKSKISAKSKKEKVVCIKSNH